jgi:hypothetical protein
MNSKIIFVKEKLDLLKRSKDKVEFKDLDFTLNLKDTAIAALLLSPLVSDNTDINSHEPYHSYDEDKINQALLLIDEMTQEKVSVLFFIGKYAAYEKDKFVHEHKNFIRDKMYGLNVIETDELRVVFYLNGNPLLHYTDEMSYDTTIISFCRLGIYIYALGGVIAKEKNLHQLPMLLFLFDSLGVDMRTYSYAYLYYKIQKDYPDYEKLLWKYKHSLLVRTFCDTFMSMNDYLKFYPKDGRPKRYNMHAIKHLVNLIKKIPIENIKDVPYEIAMHYMGEY